MATMISVERLLEQEVDEIDRFGEEKHIKPLTLSEELTDFAEKIDFYEGDISKIDHGVEEGEIDEKKREQQWPWENIHSKLRVVLSEMCVLLDVLTCLNRKKYLVLDRVSQNAEVSKATVQMLDKRKFLARAGALISKGANALRKVNEDKYSLKMDEESEYYLQLIKLRKHWRVKKTGNQIIGDISYKTSGSRFWHPGLIEVKPMHCDGFNTDDKKFSVTVGSDILPQSDISIRVTDEQFKIIVITNLPYLIEIITSTTPIWKQHLLKGQEHLFNREIFANLAQDAFQSIFVGVDVLDQKINCKLLDDVSLVISHNIDSIATPGNTEDGYSHFTSDNLRLDLYQLQCRNLKQILDTSKEKSYLKQSKSSTFNNLLNCKPQCQQQCLLKGFIDVVTHQVWVNRLNAYLTRKSNNLSDPKIIPHWNTSDRLKQSSSVCIIIAFPMFRVNILLKITRDQFALHFEDFTCVRIPLDFTLLDQVLDQQINNVIVTYMEELCKIHNWVIIYKGCDLSKAKTSSGNNTLKAYSRVRKSYLQLSLIESDDVFVGLSKSFTDDDNLLDDTFKQADIYFEQLGWKSIAGKTLTEKITGLLMSN